MRTKHTSIIAIGMILLLLSHSNAWAGDAKLTWSPPTTNTDGTPLTNLAGYKIHYGTASATYTQVVDVGLTSTPATPTYIVTNLTDGNTYYFTVTAYNSSGNESGFSSQVSKTFTGTTTTTRPTTTTTRPTTTSTTTTTRPTTTTTRPTTTSTTTTTQPTTTTTRPTTTTTTSTTTTTTTSTTTTTRPTTTTTTSTTTTTQPTTTTTTSTTTTTRPTTTTSTTTTTRPTTTTTTSTTTTTQPTTTTTRPTTTTTTTTTIRPTTTTTTSTTTTRPTTTTTRPTTTTSTTTTRPTTTTTTTTSTTTTTRPTTTTTTTSTTTTTLSSLDTTPPVIFAIAASNITDAGAVIGWTTNEASTALVEFGTTAAYGSITSLTSSRATSHAKTVSGLQASTTYHYRISGADATGNLAISGDDTFTTSEPPGTPPSIISQISVSRITAGDAVISWSTDVAATSQVEFGTTSSYGSSSALDLTLLASHGQSIAGLLPGTLYHYRVSSTDALGNLSVSSDHVFITAGPANTTPPADVQNFMAVAGDQTVSLSWTGPSDPNFTGVRILYRTDRFPTNIDDGVLLGDFTGLPDESMSATHVRLQNGVTYFYSASSYDGHGNFQSTVHAIATPSSSSSSDFSQSISGGCGMIFPTDGKPSGPGQAADIVGLVAVMLLLMVRRIARGPRFPFMPL